MWEGSGGDEVREGAGAELAVLQMTVRKLNLSRVGDKWGVNTGKLFRIIAQVDVRGKGRVGRREVDETGGRVGGGARCWQ